MMLSIAFICVVSLVVNPEGSIAQWKCFGLGASRCR
jgi:hypothetical protein